MSDVIENDYESHDDEQSVNIVKNVGFNKSRFMSLSKALGGLIVFILILYFVIFDSVDESPKRSKGSVAIKSINVTNLPNPIDFTDVDRKALNDMKIDQQVVEEKKENTAKSVLIPTAVLLADENKEEKTDEELIQKAIQEDERRKNNNNHYREDRIRVSKLYMTNLELMIDQALSEESLKSLSSRQNRTYDFVVYKELKDEIVEPSKYRSGVYNNILPKKLRYLNVIPGVLILGHDSDGGKEMIAEVLSGNFKGARLFGNVSVSQYVEKAFIKFTVMNYKDVLYDISAIAVDPNSNIPSISGKVDKHWIHNVVYGFGVGFLDAFAAVRGIQGQYTNTTSSIPGLGLVDSVSIDTDAIIQSTTALAASKTLTSLGQHRKPTYTKSAYTGVGLVFLPDGRTRNIKSAAESNNGE
ncbi:MAG: hypothetical protein QM504_03415 [Pseudomonadota bacterium]